MNERIANLADLALKESDTANERGIAQYSKRLAELIVRECARVAIRQQTENDINGKVSKNPGKDFAHALIEHFGVEE